MRPAALLAAAVLLAAAARAPGAPEPLADAGAPFGRLPLVDEVVCGQAADSARYAEEPAGAAVVQTILGRACRVLPSGPQRKGPAYFAYRIGRGKGLRSGEAYVLALDYPEDTARTWHVVNRGCEAFSGFTTGAAVGDSLHGYVGSNPESLRAPLAGGYRTWRQLFFLFDRFHGVKRVRDEPKRPDTPADGFEVVVMRPDPGDDPRSAGPAVARIRLFRVPDPARLYMRPPFPPAGLPRRHIFVREEMADGYAEGPRGGQPGLADMGRFFEDKARQMRFLCIDTFCKDLLEFGHNQGWDAGDDAWYVPSHDSGRWERIVETATRNGLSVLPYYEYAGSMGLNKVAPCVPLHGPGKLYTGISWTELYHLDVTDPRALDDARRLLERTIVRYRDRARFLGAWFRNRLSHVPVTFSDAALARFAAEAGGGAPPTRERIAADAALLERYRAWWLGKRKAFFLAVRDYLRERVGPECVLLWTNWNSEAGPLLRHGKSIVTDDPEGWKPLLPQWWEAPDIRDVAATTDYLSALTRWPATWGEFEAHHAEPRADVESYRDVDGVLFTYPFLRAFTVARPSDMDAFRGPSGLAMVRMYPLNEHRDEKLLGDFLSDVERTGPHCVLAEARAVANGDPFYLGYLPGNTHLRGFPEYVRRFHAAFLALPALPSRRIPGACADAEVVVRAIATPDGSHGTYLSVVNTGLAPKAAVEIRVPARGRVVDAASGRAVSASAAPGGGTRLRLALDACELRALRVVPSGR